MEKTLIIAEKPSVAADIVKALPGKFTKTTTHYENDNYIVSYAVGHLVSIAYPEEIDPKFQKWSLDNLPILPEEFPLAVLPDNKPQYNALSKMIRRRDVAVIVNGCDAGREGELIFKYIMKMAGNKATEQKKIFRLWLQSMTLEAIREGLAHLRENREMLPLEDTALCRSESDWLIGINATRALTGYNSRFGGFRKTPCGRVQTPTLSLLVKRETERREFTVESFWEVEAFFTCEAVSYDGLWIDPNFKKDQKNPHARHSRLWRKEQAEEIRQRCRGQEATVSETSKKSSQRASALYDLTSLQREANSRFGFSAKNTLALAQALYERHKLITYPRTDSRHLPEDYLPTVHNVVEKQRGWHFARFAEEALANNYLVLDKRIFDNKKVSDHFAIIPTTALPGKLSEPEAKIYQMIVQRFLAVFFPAAVYLNTRRLSLVAGESFLTEGKILVEAGWKAIYGSEADEAGDIILQALPTNKPVACREITAREHETKPPPRFNEATLLSAMENSGKLIEDEELAEAMKERGLGTPATRAAIIEKLINDKYIVREQRDLVPTGKAFELISLLEAMEIEVLASPEMTGEWEYKLNQILRGGMTREQFMAGIRELTQKIVTQIKKFAQNVPEQDNEAPFSPVGAMRFFATPSAYISEDKTIMIRKVLGGRVMRDAEIEALIQGETIGPMSDFRSKRGKLFTASIHLQQGKVEFLFADSTDQLDGEEIKQTKVLGTSPLDGTKVYETPLAYMSESALNGDKDKGLRISKIILERKIEPLHVEQLLHEGKTELITGFISKKRRPFDAYLLMDGKGKISFTFPPRKKKGAPDEAQSE